MFGYARSIRYEEDGREYWAVVTSGGVSVVGQGWSYTSPNIKAPEEMPTEAELQNIADAVVREYKEFMSDASPVSVGSPDD